MSDEDTVARDLLAAARDVVERASAGTRGLWPRVAATLARQSLEVALKTFWSAKVPGVERCSAEAATTTLTICPRRARNCSIGRGPCWTQLSGPSRRGARSRSLTDNAFGARSSVTGLLPIAETGSGGTRPWRSFRSST